MTLNAFESILLVCFFLRYWYVATVAFTSKGFAPNHRLFIRYRQIYLGKVKLPLLSKFLVMPPIKKTFRFFYVKQRWSRGHKARGQGQGHKRNCSPKKKVFTKIFQAISTIKRFPKNFSSAPRNFNNSKNSAVLEPRTGQFLRTWDLEAKAKDLTFEAKDCKMCPRGLHLWCENCYSSI